MDNNMVVCRVDRCTSTTINYKTGDSKTEKEIMIQFLPHRYTLDELQILEEFLGKNSVVCIFVSKQTYDEVMSNPTSFSFAYTKDGWGKNAKDFLSAEARNELLSCVMHILRNDRDMVREIEI
jgi:hypothetical protein